jgi:hypothetical protein
MASDYSVGPLSQDRRAWADRATQLDACRALAEQDLQLCRSSQVGSGRRAFPTPARCVMGFFSLSGL